MNKYTFYSSLNLQRELCKHKHTFQVQMSQHALYPAQDSQGHGLQLIFLTSFAQENVKFMNGWISSQCFKPCFLLTHLIYLFYQTITIFSKIRRIGFFWPVISMVYFLRQKHDFKKYRPRACIFMLLSSLDIYNQYYEMIQ